METFFHSIQSVLVILLLAATGYFCGARGWMNAESKKFISKFLMNVAIPCMCIYGLTGNMDREALKGALGAIVVPAICFALNYALSLLLGKLLRLPRKTLGVFMMMCSMSNSMFVGYAMCTELFGEACVPAVMQYYMVSTCYTQMVGISLVRWAGGAEKMTLKQMLQFLRSPAVLSIFAALLLIVSGIRLPAAVMSFAKYMNGLVSPLALVMMGYTIYSAGLKKIRVDLPMIVVCLFRFCIAPILFYFVCGVFGVTGLTQKVFVLEAAMPVLILSVVSAAEYGADEVFAAQGAAVTTIGCFIEIPLLMLIL